MKHVVHLIRWNLKAVYANWGQDLTTVPEREQRTTPGYFGTPHWPPISCVLPSPGRSVPSRAEVCVGSRCVRLVQALSSFPPSAGLVPCPSTLRFSFPLPFQGLPAPGQVCRVGVLSFFFCVPLFASWLSIFSSSSRSSHLHSPLILIVTSSSVAPPCQRQGVCVCDTSVQM